jgi:hypothetical protein
LSFSRKRKRSAFARLSARRQSFASVNGAIYFEWHTPLGYEEFEILSSLDAEY